MKLTPHYRKYVHGIFRYFPILYPKRCVCCEYEFVREGMWLFEHGPWNQAFGGTRRFLCKQCAPTRESAHNYANDYAKLPDRPPIRL